jgi:hypothetical protein
MQNTMSVFDRSKKLNEFLISDPMLQPSSLIRSFAAFRDKPSRPM